MVPVLWRLQFSRFLLSTLLQFLVWGLRFKTEFLVCSLFAVLFWGSRFPILRTRVPFVIRPRWRTEFQGF